VCVCVCVCFQGAGAGRSADALREHREEVALPGDGAELPGDGRHAALLPHRHRHAAEPQPVRSHRRA